MAVIQIKTQAINRVRIRILNHIPVLPTTIRVNLNNNMLLQKHILFRGIRNNKDPQTRITQIQTANQIAIRRIIPAIITTVIITDLLLPIRILIQATTRIIQNHRIQVVIQIIRNLRIQVGVQILIQHPDQAEAVLPVPAVVEAAHPDHQVRAARVAVLVAHTPEGNNLS